MKKGQFSELVQEVFGAPKEPDLPAVMDKDGIKADNPLLALRGAQSIGAPSGPMTPMPSPAQEHDPIELIKQLLGRGRVAPDGGPSMEPQDLMGMAAGDEGLRSAEDHLAEGGHRLMKPIKRAGVEVETDLMTKLKAVIDHLNQSK